jgi:DNA repair protein RadC
MILRLRTNKIKKIVSPEDVFNLISPFMKRRQSIDQMKEHFFCVGLHVSSAVVFVDLISIGNLNSAIAEPREVYRAAIKHCVNGIIIAHNHPSGNLNPSESDRKVTRKIAESGKILGIELVDSIIISKKGFYSFKNEDEL